MLIRNTVQALQATRQGRFVAECDDKLTTLIANVIETGKAGKLTITLDFKKVNGVVAVAAKVTDKTPEVAPDPDLYFPTEEGELSTDNPKQQKLDLRSAAAAPSEFKEVQAADRDDLRSAS